MGYCWRESELNGSVFAMRVRGHGVPTDVLAQHYESEGIKPAMTITVIDQRNEAVKIALEVSGEKTWN